MNREASELLKIAKEMLGFDETAKTAFKEVVDSFVKIFKQELGHVTVTKKGDNKFLVSGALSGNKIEVDLYANGDSFYISPGGVSSDFGNGIYSGTRTLSFNVNDKFSFTPEGEYIGSMEGYVSDVFKRIRKNIQEDIADTKTKENLIILESALWEATTQLPYYSSGSTSKGFVEAKFLIPGKPKQQFSMQVVLKNFSTFYFEINTQSGYGRRHSDRQYCNGDTTTTELINTLKRVYDAFLEDLQQDIAREKPPVAESVWRDFEKALVTHDWFYQRSDDPSVYRDGARERASINSMYDKLVRYDEERADKLWNKYHQD